MERIFCKIVERKKSRQIISETENTLTILSNPSLVFGRCLVVSKKRIKNLSELNKKERTVNEVVKIQETLLKRFSGICLKKN